MAIRYFEDFTIGSTLRSPEYIVSKEEIIEFAARWDPHGTTIDAFLEIRESRLRPLLPRLFSPGIARDGAGGHR